MKKVLSTVLALGLVAGVASTAAAAYDSFSVSGYYQVEGNYATNMDRSNGVTFATEDTSSAWYYHKFRLYPVLKVNDKITMYAELRLLHDDWGAGNGDDRAGSDTGDWDKMWMKYMSPIGRIDIGTTPWGSWGTSFGDSAGRQNAIKWFPQVPAPFTSVIFTGKINETDSETAAIDDQDYDYSEARFGYKTDTITTELGLGWYDDQDNETPQWGASTDTNTNKWRLRGYAKTMLAGLNVEAEFDHMFGDTETAGTTTDFDSWAAYAQVSGKAGNMGWGVMGWYTSGDSDTVYNGNTQTLGTAAGDNEAYGGPGNDFEPFLIVTGDDYGLLQNDMNSGDGGSYYAVAKNSGQIAFGGWASMPVSDKLTLTAVLGSVWADEEPLNSAGTGKSDDHYGYEFDIKADYKLLDNLTYSVNFGYFDAGDLFEDTLGTTVKDDVVLLNHTLNMKF